MSCALALNGRISALLGKSGVGKTSLLNALQPGLGLRVNQVNERTGKGKHTTTALEMFPLDGNDESGTIVDTPGIREFGLWDVDGEDLALYFPEMRPLVGRCRFGLDCRHDEEPGCAIRKAVTDGQISPLSLSQLACADGGDCMTARLADRHARGGARHCAATMRRLVFDVFIAGSIVSTARLLSGVGNRNHCPYCLHSRHLDWQRAGDRLAACKGSMQPVGLTFKQIRKKYGAAHGELMLVHRCTECGKLSINRIAADDDSETMLVIYQHSLHLDRVCPC